MARRGEHTVRSQVITSDQQAQAGRCAEYVDTRARGIDATGLTTRKRREVACCTQGAVVVGNPAQRPSLNARCDLDQAMPRSSLPEPEPSGDPTALQLSAHHGANISRTPLQNTANERTAAISTAPVSKTRSHT